MALPNPIIGGHVYNWYETSFKFDVLEVEGVLSVSGGKEKVEKAAQYGTKRKPIALTTGKYEIEPITVTMYTHEAVKVRAMLDAKSLGRGFALAKFMFSVVATGNPLEGAPPVGKVWSGCETAEFGEEYGQDVNGTKTDITFQPLDCMSIDGTSMVRELP